MGKLYDFENFGLSMKDHLCHENNNFDEKISLKDER